jgi:hypothetical protein
MPLVLLLLLLQQTGKVEGIVTEQGTTTTLQGVTVRLVPEGKGTNAARNATTDETGKFRFENVPSGRHELLAERSGFAKLKRTGGPALLRVDAGQTLKDIRIQLLKLPAITGRVLDDKGAPMRGVKVAAVKLAYTGAFATLRTCIGYSNAAITGDNGEYRLYGLEPGTYYVNAAPKMTTEPNGDPRCARVYYPNAFDPMAAVPLTLKAGTDVTGIDIRIVEPPLHTVTFKVDMPPSPSPFPFRLQVSIVRLPGNGIRAPEYMGDVGTFNNNIYTSPGLARGTYEIQFGGAAGSLFMSTGSSGRMNVTVEDRDVDAGTLVIHEPVTVAGKFTAEGTVPNNWKLGNLGVGFLPLDPRDQYAVMGNRVQDDGSFVSTTPVGDGRYQFYMSGLVEDLYLASAIVNGRNLLDGGLVIDGTAPPPVQMTIRNGGRVDGVVRNAKDEPVSESLVALIPPQNLRGNTLLFKSQATDQEGRFSFRGVAPGEYLLLAWEEVEAGATRNSEFLKEFETRGTRVTVTAGSTTTSSVGVIPAPQP